MNAHREQVISSVRRELLDHILITGETHPRQVLAISESYNRHRQEGPPGNPNGHPLHILARELLDQTRSEQHRH